MSDQVREVPLPLVPRWLTLWLLVASVAGALLLVANLSDNPTMVPAAVFLAALSAPMAFGLWVTDKTRVGRSVAPDVLFAAWVVLGGLGILFAGTFQSRFFFRPTGPGLVWVGIIEEVTKAAMPLAIYLAWPKYRSVEQMLAFAMVSAAGFATMESMTYGLAALDESIVEARNVLLWRSVVTPFAHLPWTGLAVVVAAKAFEPRDRFTLRPSAWWGLFAAIGLHTLWNLTLREGGWALLATPIVAGTSFWLFLQVIRDVFYDGPYVIPTEHAVRPRWLARSPGLWTPARRAERR